MNKMFKKVIRCFIFYVIISVFFTTNYANAAGLMKFSVELSPYSKEFLNSINLTYDTALKSYEIIETLVSLNEYYCKDVYLGDELLSEYDIRSNLTNSFKDDFLPAAAATWAYNNYDKYDSNFPNCTSLGGDCTNFVSQALYYGGMEMHSDWYCYKNNSTYPQPTTTSQLNYSWALADPSPWISVTQFTEYWDDNCDDYYEFTRSDYTNNHNTYYFYEIYQGDVIILCTQTLWWTTPSHAMIITQFDQENEDFLLAGHSNERQDYPLLSAISGYAKVRILCL